MHSADNYLRECVRKHTLYIMADAHDRAVEYPRCRGIPSRLIEMKRRRILEDGTVSAAGIGARVEQAKAHTTILGRGIGRNISSDARLK